MNTILNKIGATRVTPARFFGFWAILFTLVLALTSCSDDLDVQQSYPFTVEVMPYGDKITKGHRRTALRDKARRKLCQHPLYHPLLPV